MSDFQELIKNFERIRDYMRQFFVYGFKVRTDYDVKSARTYDNERRRIESLLSAYTASEYTAKGKKVYISVDSKTIPQNPLYAAWKSKSFTDNDIMLHFFLPLLLSQSPDGLSAGEAAEQISLQYAAVFDSQTIRLKLKEYEKKGIFVSLKSGKELRYRLAPFLPAEKTPVWKRFVTALTYYQEAAPFGFIGSTLLDRENTQNRLFQFKHHFIVHTLEDGVLYDILSAMKEHREVLFVNKSHRSGHHSQMQGIPLKIFVSTQTGRRYLCLYLTERRRFLNVRLDSMSDIKKGETFSDYPLLQDKLMQNLPACYGVSFGGSIRMEEIYVRLYIDEQTESYIINRLYRESRGGEVMRIRTNEYLYSAKFFDTNEMLSWVKTFTGRILDIQGSNQNCINKVTDDWNRMYDMYCKGENEDGSI